MLPFTLPFDTVHIQQVGSSLLNVKAQDVDYMILTRDLENKSQLLQPEGWQNTFHNWNTKARNDPGKMMEDQCTMVMDYNVRWRLQSWRRESINLVMTDSPQLYSIYLAGSCLVASMNLTEKKDRINLFQMLKFGTGDWSWEDFPATVMSNT